MDFMTLLSEKLEEKGLNALDVLDQHDDFYRVMSLALYGNTKTKSKMRQSIYDFQIESQNIPYFELFLPRCRDEISPEITIRQEFLADAKRSNTPKEPPTAREIYAACEFVGRPLEVLVCDIVDEDGLAPPRLHWRVFLPVLDRKTPKETGNSIQMLLLLTGNKTVFHGFSQKRKTDYVNRPTGDSSGPSFRRCHGDKFANTLHIPSIDEGDVCPSDVAEWTPSTGNSFYRCMSREMYGDDVHWERVKNLVLALEEKEDNVNVFASFITSSDKSTEMNQALKEHISKSRAIDKPLKNEMHAAASLLNVPIYIQSFINGADTWEMYPPITDGLQGVDQMQSFVALRHAKESDQYSQVLSFREDGQNSRETAPRVPGNLSTIQEQIDGIAQTMLTSRGPCCRDHTHLVHLDTTGRDTNSHPRRNPFKHPPSNVRNILRLLRSDGRELEKIEAYNSTLFRCISKEVFGTEDNYEDIRSRISNAIQHSKEDEDVMPSLVNMREQDQGRVIQSASDWLGVSVYIYTQTDGSGDVAYQWRPYHPTRSRDELVSFHSLGCRYYITLFYDCRSRKFDRVIPIRGCNCQLMSPIPLFISTFGDVQHVGIITVSREDRHMTLMRRQSAQLSDDNFTCEIRRPIVARQFTERYSVLHERADMSCRFLDTVHLDAHSFYRCLSKELFGSQDHFSLVRLQLLDVIQSVHKELQDDLNGFAAGSTVSNVEDMTKRIANNEDAGKEEIQLASSVFAISVYVLSRDDVNDITSFAWRHYPWNVLKKTSSVLDCQSRSRHACPSGGRYYVAMFLSSAGHFDRVVPKYEVCNCALPLPGDEVSRTRDPGEVRLDTPNMSFELRSLLVTRKVDKCLTKLTIALNTWLEASEETEQLCVRIVNELENRRFGVNIATIMGGSTGLVGAALAVVGVISIPFTGGLSFGLTIAGAVVSGVGGATMAGSKITEVYLGSKATDVLKEKQRLLKGKSDDLKEVITEFLDSVKTMEIDVKELLRDDTLQNLDTAIFATIGTLIRTLQHLYVIPMMVLRVSFQGVAIISSILIPLAVIVDVGSIAHAGWNLFKKSKTNVSEELRAVAALLRSCRVQLDAWAYGNRQTDEQSTENTDQ